MKHNLSNWDLFVLRHRRPLNLVIHFISLLCFYLAPIVSLITRNPWYLSLFFASGIIGAIGHYVSGDGGVNLKETTSSPSVVLFVPKMFLRILSGAYSEDLKTAEAKYNESLRA